MPDRDDQGSLWWEREKGEREVGRGGKKKLKDKANKGEGPLLNLR